MESKIVKFVFGGYGAHACYVNAEIEDAFDLFLNEFGLFCGEQIEDVFVWNFLGSFNAYEVLNNKGFSLQLSKDEIDICVSGFNNGKK